MMIYSQDTVHPQHPHHLECPRCQRHTVVQHGETRYVCLSCGWFRDVSDWELRSGLPAFVLLFLVGIIVVILLQ